MEAAPTTVLDAVKLLESQGFEEQIILGQHGLRCVGCDTNHEIDRAEVLRVYRFEGASDPDEQAVVYGLRCPSCGALGTLVSNYGADADPALADHLVMLDERFKSNPGEVR